MRFEAMTPARTVSNSTISVPSAKSAGWLRGYVLVLLPSMPSTPSMTRKCGLRNLAEHAERLIDARLWCCVFSLVTDALLVLEPSVTPQRNMRFHLRDVM